MFAATMASFAFLVMPNALADNTAQSCVVDLTKGYTEADWTGAMYVEGSDGFMWQRAIVRNDDQVLLREGEQVTINGTAKPNNEVQMYLWKYEIDDEDRLQKPGEGTCIGLGSATPQGEFSVMLDPIFFWANIDEKMVFDVYYKTEQQWADFIARQQDGNGSEISTIVYPKVLDIVIDFFQQQADNTGGMAVPPPPPPPAMGESNTTNNDAAPPPPAAPPAPGGTNNDANKNAAAGDAGSGPGGIPPPPPPPSIGGNADTSAGSADGGPGLLPPPPPPGPGGNGVDFGDFPPPPARTPGIGGNDGANPPVSDNPTGGQEICEKGTVLAVRLDPAQLPPELQGNFFDSVGSQTVTVGRNPGAHTFFVSTENGDFDQDTLATFSKTAISMEVLKRSFLGVERAGGRAPGLPSMTVQALTQAANGDGPSSAETKELARQVKNLYVTGQAERSGSLLNVSTASKPRNKDMAFDILAQNIPMVKSTEDKWAYDFLYTLDFWTGSVGINENLVVHDNSYWRNFTPRNARFEKCDMKYTHGQSPRILVTRDEEMILEPDFTDVKLVYADTRFSHGEGWELPKGVKEDIFYLYEATTDIDGNYLADACLKREDLNELSSAIQSKLGLTNAETDVITAELESQTDDNENHYGIKIADPKVVANYFKWKGNDEPLDILQLFFSIEANGCDTKFIGEIPASISNPDRDGVEAGILERK